MTYLDLILKCRQMGYRPVTALRILRDHSRKKFKESQKCPMLKGKKCGHYGKCERCSRNYADLYVKW